MASDGFQLGVKIFGVTITVNCQCACGKGHPVQVVFRPGVTLTTTCPGCEKRLRLGRLIFDAEKGDSLTIGLAELAPELKLAGPGDLPPAPTH
jgi:hypothetical protein